MSIACVLSNYLRGDKGDSWVNSISGLYSFLLHKLEYCGDLIRTSDNVAYILYAPERKLLKYSLGIITLPKLFLFVYVYVYAEYVLYTKLIYKYNILAQMPVFRWLTSNYF